MNTSRRHSWMWAEACALLDTAERRQRQFFNLLTPAAAPAWEPPANIFSSGSEMLVEIALPGARAEDVIVQLTPSGLLVETTIPPPSFPAELQLVRLEIPYGRLRRRIDLPPGRYVLREHRLENGCLYLRLSGSTL